MNYYPKSIKHIKPVKPVKPNGICQLYHRQQNSVYPTQFYQENKPVQ